MPVDDDDVGEHTRFNKRRKYTMRKKRAGAPRVPIQCILTSKPVVVCHMAALFLFGVSAQRVQRVLEGQEDGQKEGMMLPNDSLKWPYVCLSPLPLEELQCRCRSFAG